MYVLHAYPDNSSLAAHLVLRATGAPHRIEWVDYAARKHPAFLAINPAGQVPSLQGPDAPVHETAAICLYLADRHPEAGLAPAIGHRDRSAYLQWLFYLASNLHMGLNLHADARSCWLPDDPAGDVLTSQADAHIGRILARIEADLAAGGPYLLGNRVSAADCYLLMLATWTRFRNSRASDHPALRRFMDLMLDHPAVRAVIAIERLEPPYY